ncbi:LysM peptidoglycan-binding domain-containing protein [Nitratireductor sp. ZSWI3]|uniref:LysM peptidoglycan-binding domain-containing protein n=1 Tax=Nitratireductor sp. ZSWI3 TaxID=2966359 RepID=UPI00214F9052|nr:LysM peptidoglycan-binding domain-containing protein [Nitratireductor sp. ZSWI3]MCR4264818.1 SH3 domain-containing protein [Nitratireductor sp. ZSWI3]
MALRPILLSPPPPRITPKSGVEQVADLRTEAQTLRNNIRLANKMGEHDAVSQMQRQLALVNAQLARLETAQQQDPASSTSASPTQARPVVLTSSNTDGTNGAPVFSLANGNTSGGTDLSFTPVRYDLPTDAAGEPQDDAATAQAEDIFDDIAAGKSIDLIAAERNMTRDQVIAQLEAGGYEVRTTEPTSDNGDVRTTEVEDADAGETVTEYYDFQHGAYYTTVEGDEGETSSPLRDERGWTVEETYDAETGINTARYEDDLGSGTVVERTELPNGVVIEETTEADGSTSTVVKTPDGEETTLAEGQDPTREGVDDIVDAVQDGKSIEEIAAEEGLTKDQVIAQLAAAGLDVRTWEPTSDNGDVRGTEIVDAATDQVISAHYHDYHHDAVTVQYVDADGNEVSRTEYADGKVSETVTDKDGRKTTTITEPVNDGEPVEHEVKDNESLTEIAEEYGVTLDDIRAQNPQFFENGRDPDIIHEGETVVVEDGTKTTVMVTFNGHTLTTAPDGSMTLTNHEDGTEIEIKAGSVEEALARTLLAANPESSDPATAKEGEIVVAAVTGLLAGQSYEELLAAAGERQGETQAAIEQYGLGPKAEPYVEVDENGNQVINFQGQPPAGTAPSGGAWVPVKVDGVWHWVDPEVAKAIYAENTALGRLTEAQARFDVLQAQLDVWALDPAYEGAMDNAAATIDEALGRHGLRWVRPEPEGSLEDARNRLSEANGNLEDASGALEAYENAEALLDQAIDKQGSLPLLSDPNTPTASAIGSEAPNRHVEYAEGLAKHAEVTSLFYQADYQRTNGDKLSMDYTVSRLEDLLAQTEEGSNAHTELTTALEQARELQEALGGQLEIAEAYANFYDARSNLADLEAQAEDIEQRVLAEYNSEHEFLFEEGKKHRTVGGDYLGTYDHQEVVTRDGQLWVINHFSDGKTEQQLTYSLTEENVNDDYRDRPLNQEWQALASGQIDTTMCTNSRLEGLKSAELVAGRELNQTLAEQLGVSIENLDEQIGQLQEELEKLNKPANYMAAPELPEGVEPVKIDVGGQEVYVSPEVAERYDEIGLDALAESDQPVRIQIDTDGDGTAEWHWVSAELAYAATALKVAQEQKAGAEDTRSSAEAAANWYDFQLSQPLKLRDDAETDEYNARLQDAYLEEHEGQMLDERVQPQVQALYEQGYNDPRALSGSNVDQQIAGALNMNAASEDGAEALEKVKDEIRDVGGDDADFRIVPVFYVDEAVGMQQTALFAVEDGDGKTWYIDATGKKFDSVEDFQDNNQQFQESGKLILPTDLRFQPGENGEFSLDVVQARNVSTWDKVVDPIIGIGSGLAGLAALIPTPASPFLAGAAYAGAAYLGAKTAYNQYNHIQHGGEWNDSQSVMNGLMITTVVLPGVSSGLRTIGMTGRTLATGERIGLGRAFLSSIGAVKPNTPLAEFAGNYMRHPGVLNRLARGADWTAVGTGAPLMAASVHDLAVYGDQMSGLERANALVGLGTGLIGTTLGSRALVATRPVKPSSDGNTIALMAPGGEMLNASILGNPPKNASKVYVPADWGRTVHGDAPGTAGKTHIAVRDPDTGEIVVVPWIRGASQEHQPTPAGTRNGPDIEQARALSEDDIRSLTDNDIALIGDDVFSVFSSTQIGAFTATQVKQFTRGQIRGISADKIGSLDVGALRPEQVPWMTREQVSGLTGNQLRDMSNAGLQAHFTKPQLRAVSADNIRHLDVSGLTSRQVPWLTNDQTAAITGRQLRDMGKQGLQAHFTKGQIESIPTTNIRQLDVGGLKAKQVPWLTGDQIGSLSAAQWRDLGTAGLQGHLTRGQVRSIPEKSIRHVDVGGFSKKQVRWLTDGQVGKLTLSQLNSLGENGLFRRLSQSQIASISGENMKRLDLPTVLDKKQIPWLTRAQVQRLTGEQLEALCTAGLMNQFTENQLSAIPDRRIKHIDMEALKAEQMPWLTTAQVAKLTDGQMKQLSDAQLKALTREQVEALRSEQQDALTPEQRKLIDLDYARNLSTDDIAGLSVADWEGLGTAQMQMLEGDQLRAIPLNRIKHVRIEALKPEQLAEFTPEQVAKFTAQQMASLSLEQLAAFTKPQSDVLKPIQTSLLKGDQVGAINGYTAPPQLRRALAAMRANGYDTLLMTGTATGVLTAVWPALPENVRVHLNAGGFFVRGASIIIKDIFPNATAADTRLGRVLRAVDVITFIPNMANGNRTIISEFQTGAYLDMTDGVTFNLANWWYSAKSLKEVATGRKAFPWIDKPALSLYLGGSLYYSGKVGYDLSIGKYNRDPELLNAADGPFPVVSDFLSNIQGGMDSTSAVLFTAGSYYLLRQAYKPAAPGSKMPRIVDGVAFGGGLLLFGLSTWATVQADSANAGDAKDGVGPDETAPGEIPPEETPPEPPEQEPRPQLVVTAPDGLNLREAPASNAERQTTLRPGSFVQETGERVTDETGNEWVPVSGYGWDGQHYEGWVSGSHLSLHEAGAQDESGRYNPELERQGYDWVVVRDGQSIGSIARDRAADVADTVVLNMEHIQVPDLVFAGDRVYLPQAVG